jgi:hypothetical protein
LRQIADVPAPRANIIIENRADAMARARQSVEHGEAVLWSRALVALLHETARRLAAIPYLGDRRPRTRSCAAGWPG